MNFEAVVLGDLAEIFPDAKVGKVGGNYVAQDIEWSKRNRYVEWFGTDDGATVHFIGADAKREYRLYFVFTSLNRIVYAGYEDGGDERDVVITDVFEHSPVKDNFIKINKLIEDFKAFCPEYQPNQPVYLDPHGTIRFRKNAIVDALLEFGQEHGFGLNQIACKPFSREDRIQFAQLIGYSVSGWGSLSYCDDVVYEQVESTENYKKILKSLDKSE